MEGVRQYSNIEGLLRDPISMPARICRMTGKRFLEVLTWGTLRKIYLSPFGEVVDCIIKSDLVTGRAREFEFVLFKDATCVNEALELKEHKLDSKLIYAPMHHGPKIFFSFFSFSCFFLNS
ncbi:hypothetical protein HJG60_007885 [Phyllostomus discolor]|uniref:RRM domain-containing protein n=1 Tax=Phyllostomus discolor TaxID=89673 RepID=A0A834BKT5_9CHIR|nr:hypothetical protein HJG60_007885 [Phyllostomus discolor]